MKDPLFLIVDLFCGAGGVTTGFVQAEMEGTSLAKVIACVNHDPKAIQSHWRNHPEVKHFEEDIRTLDLEPLVKLVQYNRKKYPNALLILWASLECTNFSKAKGGLPRDADSRTLADHLPRYSSALRPDYIMIENVVEFMSWGPLNEKGKPVSRKNGQDWLRWRAEMRGDTYPNSQDWNFRDEWCELNSANFGAYTSRNRLFGVFARPWLPIVWPESTHVKVRLPKSKPYTTSIFEDRRLPWKAVKEVLDFSDEGTSIFNRDKSLSDKTLERIFAGLVKYVANGDTSFIQKHFSGKPNDKNVSVDGPTGTITTKAHQSLVQAKFLLKYNSTNKETGKHVPPSVDEPAPVVSTQGRLGLVQPKFLTHYYGTGGQHSSVENPAPTIPTKARTALISPEFLTIYNGKSECRNVDDPAPVIACNDRLALVQPFLMPTNFDNQPKSVEGPCPTVTANRKHHYLVNPQWGGHPGSVEAPCPVIIARQDKAPLYLVQLENGPFSVPIYDSDSEIMIQIKQFMALYNIVDIKMRMLRVHELLKIQGFPADYKLEGNQADQKKFIGNSVVPLVVKKWTEALAMRLIESKSQVA